jgi:nitrate reductase NapAB chaperone NapD
MRSVFLIFVSGCCLGCGIADDPDMRELKNSLRITGEEVVAKQDKTIAVIESTRQEIVSQNEQIIDTLKIVEASLVVPKVEPGKEVIKSAPESPAKANTALASVKVATPGTSSRTASDGTTLRWNIENDWNPSILETSAHLRTDHGIETNGMTHQEMADIHASIHEGKQTPVSAVRVKNASSVSHCPGGNCPTNRTQRRRGLLGGLFR